MVTETSFFDMDTSHSRPLGVTLTAFLALAVAVISLLIAARYVLNPAGDQQMILLFTRLKLPITFLNLLAVPPLISAGLATLMFRGLWEENAWSRVAAVLLGFIGMLTALAAIAFVQVFNFGGSRAVWIAAGVFALSALIFVYFLKTPWPDSDSAPSSRRDAIAPQASSDVFSPPVSPEISPAMTTWPPAYDLAHSAPTVMTDAVAPKDADTVRLTPEVEPQSQPLACLTALSGEDRGRRFEIFAADVLLGRHPTLTDMTLTDPTISARHARIRYEEGYFTIYDLDSTNGSFVNGRRIRMQRLDDQDQITLGAVEFLFTLTCQN